MAQLRIASLLPSTTDICISLGLEHNVVGITHECDFPQSHHPLYLSAAPLIVYDDDDDGDGGDGRGQFNGGNDREEGRRTKPPLTLTVSQIDPHLQSQAEIDAAVKSSLHNGLSLYNLADSALTDARPTLILTQSLCDVCAVATSAVTDEVTCNFRPGQCRVLSLEPESLEEVVETFVTVAEACGVKERGLELERKFWEGAQQILQATSLSKRKDYKPRVLFFEWMDPPFDAGHWIPDMMERSGCVSALPGSKNTRKSVQLSWEQIYDCDPDVVIIGCCGFDLRRNEEDARVARKKLEPLRAFRKKNIYASDGNMYFARPGPGLRDGISILSRCAYDEEDKVVEAIERLPFLPKENAGWSKIVFPDDSPSSDAHLVEIEDLVNENFMKVHNEACNAKKQFYQDPATGYNVYTEYAHKKRGKCCGSGCRHCPYNHENVKDKAKHIQQPAILYEGEDSAENSFLAPLSSIPPRSHVKVLFFSGGKDSFLAIRALVKEARQQGISPFHLILLTTFDAESRIIAHQEIPIDTVLRQAQHLGLPLLAIPLQRGSGEAYLSRVEKGLDVIRQREPTMHMTLAFGDLHLDHIRKWRDDELSEQYSLAYPLWEKRYEDLMKDLEISGVPVVVSAVTVTTGGLEEGMQFTRTLWQDVVHLGMDGFGEAGEFHSVAEVWVVPREQALGL